MLQSECSHVISYHHLYKSRSLRGEASSKDKLITTLRCSYLFSTFVFDVMKHVTTWTKLEWTFNQTHSPDLSILPHVSMGGLIYPKFFVSYMNKTRSDPRHCRFVSLHMLVCQDMVNVVDLLQP